MLQRCKVLDEEVYYKAERTVTYFTSLGSPTWQTPLSTSPSFPTLNSGALWLQQEFSCRRKNIMLIVNDEQRLRAGIGRLSKRCQYCSKALAAYPLILSDDARLAVYHAACAAEFATEILVDLSTLLPPPPPSHQLSILPPPPAAPNH